jgi:ATP-dependent DNA helicase RecQ
MAHIIDVLRGSKKEKIKQYRHDQLSTHGIGKDRSLDEWRHLGRSLLQQNLLLETNDGYPTLMLNPGSWEILRGQRKVLIAVPQRLDRSLEDSLTESTPSQDSERLFEALRQLRKRIADEQNVPPYVVFSDASLRQMAQYRPQTLESFGQISGVGSHKLDQYGDRFLPAIQSYCQTHGLDSLPMPRPGGSTSQRSRNSSNNGPNASHLHTYALYQAGHSLQEIAQARDLRSSTVLDHLILLIEHGKDIDLYDFVTPEVQAEIEAAIQTVGAFALTPLYDFLQQRYDYDTLKIVRAFHRRQAKAS